jgi:hypothetical protein
MFPTTDDYSIKDHVFRYRGIKASELAFDTAGNAVFSDGAFRSQEVSTFRVDEASPADVANEYPAAVRVVCIAVGDVRKAGCIVANQVPPKGHVCIYRKDTPGQRISGGSAGMMAKKAKLVT